MFNEIIRTIRRIKEEEKKRIRIEIWMKEAGQNEHEDIKICYLDYDTKYDRV